MGYEILQVVLVIAQPGKVGVRLSSRIVGISGSSMGYEIPRIVLFGEFPYGYLNPQEVYKHSEFKSGVCEG